MNNTGNPEVEHFREVAARYCEFIQNCASLSVAELLAEAERFLPALHLAALELPEWPEEGPCSVPRFSRREMGTHYVNLGKVLGSCNLYREIYDPAAMSDPSGAIDGGDEPVVASLADDLTDIWGDLSPGVRAWGSASKSTRREIVAAWRGTFGYHWGQHLVDALRSVHWWRHVHHVGEEEESCDA